MRGQGGKRPIPALAAALIVMLLGTLTASGQSGQGKRVIQVRPGHNAIAKALRKADAGDRLRVHRGRYRESFEVTKPVEIVGVGKGQRPVIDAQCKSDVTVNVRVAGVALEHLKVTGATDIVSAGREVDLTGVASGTLEDLRLRNTCSAQYGINVYQSGPISITGNRATGYTDGGIYVGGVTDTLGATLLVQDNEAYDNNKGIIIEESAGGDIRIVGNDVHDNARAGLGEMIGIFVHTSKGVLVAGNSVTANGNIGIYLADANDNVLNDNRVSDNPTDLLDAGAGNCGSGNTFSTGGSLPPC
jgi:parallel beta-helix repeat protein